MTTNHQNGLKMNIITQKMKCVITLLTFVVSMGALAQNPDVSLDFTTNSWGITTGKGTGTHTYSSGDYSITLYAPSSGGDFHYNSVGFLLMGKNGAYLTLPAFDFDVAKIEIKGRTDASGLVKQNIYVGSTAVSTETTGATGTNTYIIADGYQTAGNRYTLKVNSSHNTQITAIHVYKKNSLRSLAISGDYPTDFYVNETFRHDGSVVTAYFDDGTSQNVTEKAVFSAPDMTTTGEKTVTVIYTRSGETKETTYTINVLARPTYTISFSEGHDNIVAELGETVTLPTLPNVGDYTFVGWSETDYTTEVTTATFIVPSEAYTATNNVLFYPVYSIPQGNTENETASLSIPDYATAHSWEDSNRYEAVAINDFITATASLVGSYTGSYYTSNNSWRFYESDNGTLTLSISEGTLVSAAFTFSVSNNGAITYNGSRYASGKKINLSGTRAEFGVTHTSGNKTGNIQITNIEVVYSQQTIAYISHPRTCNVTVTAGGQGSDGKYYATYTSDYNLDFSSVDGLEAFIVVAAPYEGEITVSPIERVPANTPVLVCGSEAKDYQVRVCGITEDVSGNQLQVATVDTKGDGETIFVLAKERLGLGFYRVKVGVSLNVGKAYLQIEKRINGQAGKSFISLGGDDANAIDALEMMSEQNKSAIYNLKGQRVIVPVKGGLYMMNGKKLMVK